MRVDDVKVERTSSRAVVTAHVQWSATGVTDEAMTVGDLRLVAVSEKGHLPFVLGTQRHDLDEGVSRDVTFTVTDDDALAAMRAGNRVVLTASQHQDGGPAVLSVRTYVTVAQVQPFGSPQPNIGRRDCSHIPISPGAKLHYCDLVGAYLDSAQVSLHDPAGADSTRMERADLTGATAVRADFSGATIAGGRANGLDLRNAKLDNLSLAGAEAIELSARGATSDARSVDSAANMFRTNLTGADLRNTVFHGVSVSRARLDGAHLAGADWSGLVGDGATFRGADLTGITLTGASLYFSDLEDANLTRATLHDAQMAWSWLCRTTLPAGSTLDGSRDCRTATEADRLAHPLPDRATPYVTVDASLGLASGGSATPSARTVTARVVWDPVGVSGYGMTQGDVRLIAVDRTTGVPTVLDTRTYDDLAQSTDYEVTIDDRARLATMSAGNRIVLTATQHPPRPLGGSRTQRSYVTVDVLQRGPGLGRIGRYDCSRVALTAEPTKPLNFCDLSAATLDYAALNGRLMYEVDLTGATLRRGALSGVTLDGSRLSGLQAPGASINNSKAYDVWAPRLDLSNKASIYMTPLWARTLDDADFSDSTLSESPVTAASLLRATFSRATVIHPDWAFATFAGAQFDSVDASKDHPSLFLADLTGVDMSGSQWILDEEGNSPWLWATLCGTKMPKRDFGISGDRDCPR